MFIDRYIKVPIKLYDGKSAEALGKDFVECESFTVKVRLDPERIESYYPCVPGKEDFLKENMTAVHVMMWSGEHWVVMMEIKEFEQLLNGIKDDE